MPSSEPLILGHRGASAVAPENTLAAFAQANDDGSDGIEFDVRLSSDGVAVVIHDDTLRRTALVPGSVSAMTAAELQKVDVGSWFTEKFGGRSFSTETIPTLADVFDLFAVNNGVLYVEMKCDDVQAAALATAVVRQISAHKMRERVVVESFALPAIEAVKRIDPHVRTAALFEPKISKPVTTWRTKVILDRARQHGADEIALHHSLARTKLIRAAKDEDFEVVVWTVDDVAWIDRARAHLIKALISNNPRLMVEARDRSLQIRPR
ncbi:MAG TPA: glycerophosphodiester phosphodiesterase family protein [Pyrinomonadaceae bacterium]|nr:glycerophosphodiester phosphodiesterase family protein [Pyrinomonadaceae bacterium]